MTRADLPLPQQQRFGETSRTDRWWLQPLLVFLGLGVFVVYSTWAAFQGTHYWYEGSPAEQMHSQYLSPFYSPVLFTVPERAGAAPIEHSWFGAWPQWLANLWPGFIPLTPALLILWGPGLFRFTCYYYRGAYYKAFWQDPTNCAVGEPRKGYRGERWFPLIFQNIHRYFLYVAIVFLGILTYDAVISYIFIDRADGSHHFGIGVGSLVLTLNVILLGGYTFGCHSLRHIIGGHTDQFSCAPARYKAWQCVSCFNRRHALWAWLSLVWVGFSDVYVRLCSIGVWSDLRVVF